MVNNGKRAGSTSFAVNRDGYITYYRMDGVESILTHKAYFAAIQSIICDVETSGVGIVSLWNGKGSAYNYITPPQNNLARVYTRVLGSNQKIVIDWHWSRGAWHPDSTQAGMLYHDNMSTFSDAA